MSSRLATAGCDQKKNDLQRVRVQSLHLATHCSRELRRAWRTERLLSMRVIVPVWVRPSSLSYVLAPTFLTRHLYFIFLKIETFVPQRKKACPARLDGNARTFHP